MGEHRNTLSLLMLASSSTWISMDQFHVHKAQGCLAISQPGLATRAFISVPVFHNGVYICSSLHVSEQVILPPAVHLIQFCHISYTLMVCPTYVRKKPSLQLTPFLLQRTVNPHQTHLLDFPLQKLLCMAPCIFSRDRASSCQTMNLNTAHLWCTKRCFIEGGQLVCCQQHRCSSVLFHSFIPGLSCLVQTPVICSPAPVLWTGAQGVLLCCRLQAAEVFAFGNNETY